ncbi:hypothetical protein LguiA_033314 [Lonicera macranthoides]
MSTNNSSSSKKRKAKQSQTQNPTTKNSQSQDDHEESTEPIIIVPYIPAPIVIDILLRTPIKALFNCRLLCKNWATLTSTPKFSQLHLLRSPINCLIKPGVKRLQSKGLELVDLGCPFSPSSKLVFIPKINFPNVPIRLFNSCNGPSLDSSGQGPFICCFDFMSEQFGEVPKPSNMQYGYQKRVSVINGNISVCDFSNDQIAIWVMKEYGVKVSWRNDIVITCPIYGFDTYEPIMINDNGKILMIYDNWSFVFYDPKSKALIVFGLQILFGTKTRFEAIAHVPSLISLMDVAKRIK